MKTFLICFIPIFVGIDVFSIIPLFLALTEGMDPAKKKRLISSACLTALAISFAFLAIGKAIFTFLGITESDFRIGGGIVLLVVAITDLMSTQDHANPRASEDVGIVPIGIPLIMGPAALTSVLITAEAHGQGFTLAALLVNLALVWIVFRQSHQILKIMGQGGAKAFAKVSSLFLAAIAVMMIRVGLMNILH